MVSDMDNLRPGGSSILPEETPPKFFARHLSAYRFALPFVKGKDVLEIGFGDGYGANFLAGSARNVKAVDVLDRNVELASSKYKRHNLEFRKSFGAYLDFSSGMFDAVVSFQVIEHIPENEIHAYIASIKRVLKKGGIAFISTLNLDKNKKPDRPYAKNPFHVKEFTYKEFDSTVKAVFEDCEIHGLFYTARLKFYERLKKLGIFRIFPQRLNIVDRYYSKITTDDFIWRKTNLPECVDFMAMCVKK